MVAPTKNWLGTLPSPQPFPPGYYFTNSLEFPIVRSYCDAFFLHQKYVVEGLTPAQIAAETFSSKKTVVSWLHRQKIPLKPEGKTLSQTPYGFRRVHGRLLESPQEQKTISRLSDLQKQGFSYREMAEIMNSLKIPTRKLSGRWHIKTIHKVLTRSSRRVDTMNHSRFCSTALEKSGKTP